LSFHFVLAPEQAKDRVDKILPGLLRGVSRATVQRWISEGRVRVDGELCRARDEIGAGAVIDVDPGPPPPSDVEPDPTVPFEVLHEDEHLIVVDKPPGVVVHPGRGNWNHTLVAGLLARGGFERAPFDPRDPLGRLRPGIVHRLDKDTSGVLVVAKTESSREALKKQLSAHTVERTYRGITLGVPTAGRIETLHGRHPGSRFRFTSRVETGRVAVTHVTVEQALRRGQAALVSCRLETGRTHQIRVHLAERGGAPILADSLYGRTPADGDLRAIAARLGRQALHASVLGFEHPGTGQRVRFETDLPDDMKAALEKLRLDAP
jgi:23S rRNA pseudouridine1911/1915/1917 synthase